MTITKDRFANKRYCVRYNSHIDKLKPAQYKDNCLKCRRWVYVFDQENQLCASCAGY